MSVATLDMQTFTTTEVADHFGYSDPACVRQLVARMLENKIEVGRKLGRDWLFTEADLLRMEEFLKNFGRKRKNA